MKPVINRRRAWRKALSGGVDSVTAFLDDLISSENRWIEQGYSDGNYARALINESLENCNSDMRAVLLEYSCHLPAVLPFSFDGDFGIYREPGETVCFGSWPQGENGEPEPIEWLILENLGDSRMMITRHAIDCIPYHDRPQRIDWAESSLRQFLNGQFLKTAFTESEIAQIIEVHNSNSDNPLFGTSGGADTQDRVFLLSTEQAMDPEFFETDTERVCKATPYAITKGGKSYRGASWWWLRSPGSDPYYVAHVDYSGTCYPGGVSAYHAPDCVRPVIVVKL